MLVTELPMGIEVKPEQPLNAAVPMLVTELPIVIEVKPEQPLNAAVSMLVTELGMVIEVTLQSLKAFTPIDVTG